MFFPVLQKGGALRVKNHTFNGNAYVIDVADAIEGVCDTLEEGPLEMIILEGSDFRAFNSAVHEGLHAFGVPSEYLHKSDGTSKTEDYARFLWRMRGRWK